MNFIITGSDRSADGAVSREYMTLLSPFLKFDRSHAGINNICDLAFIDLTKNINGAMDLHVIASTALAVGFDFTSNFFLSYSTRPSFHISTPLQMNRLSAFFALIAEIYFRSGLTFWEHRLSRRSPSGVKLFRNGFEKLQTWFAFFVVNTEGSTALHTHHASLLEQISFSFAVDAPLCDQAAVFLINYFYGPVVVVEEMEKILFSFCRNRRNTLIQSYTIPSPVQLRCVSRFKTSVFDDL